MKATLYRGYKSAKLHMSYVIMALMTFGWLATAKWQALVVTFPEYIMGLLTASGIAFTGNLVEKHLMSKKGLIAESSDPVPEEDPPK